MKNPAIAAKKHDLTGIRVYDKLEEELPNLGIVPMVDNETQKRNGSIPAQKRCVTMQNINANNANALKTF